MPKGLQSHVCVLHPCTRVVSLLTQLIKKKTNVINAKLAFYDPMALKQSHDYNVCTDVYSRTNKSFIRQIMIMHRSSSTLPVSIRQLATPPTQTCPTTTINNQSVSSAAPCHHTAAPCHHTAPHRRQRAIHPACLRPLPACPHQLRTAHRTQAACRMATRHRRTHRRTLTRSSRRSHNPIQHPRAHPAPPRSLAPRHRRVSHPRIRRASPTAHNNRHTCKCPCSSRRRMATASCTQLAPRCKWIISGCRSYPATRPCNSHNRFEWRRR